VPELFPYLMDNLERPARSLRRAAAAVAIARRAGRRSEDHPADEPNEGIQPSIVEEIEAVIIAQQGGRPDRRPASSRMSCLRAMHPTASP